MRRENLPAGGHDKVIWKRSRDRSRDKASRQRNSETWWRRTTATLLGVSFGSYRRRRRDVLMGRHGYVPLRRLGDVPLNVVGCFIWDLFETSWRRTDETSSLRPLETWSRHTNKTSWRRTTDTSWRRSTVTSWVFHSRCTCDFAGTYKETPLRCRHDVLLPGGFFLTSSPVFLSKNQDSLTLICPYKKMI